MISLKLALRFLFLNKRLSFLMLGVLSLGIVILCSVNLVTQELLNQIKEKEYLKYGACAFLSYWMMAPQRTANCTACLALRARAFVPC